MLKKKVWCPDAVARFVEREIGRWRRARTCRRVAGRHVAGMREMGLFGCIILERNTAAQPVGQHLCHIVERIKRVWMSVSGIITHLIMAACVQRNGTEAQRQRFRRSCQRRTARRAGTDRARLRHRSAGGAHGGAPRR